ncbi:hypothetical protein BLA24_09455 [Streptomyces cinnamoneus]|uniref:OmpR/PhoB-type domain-containing protein n=1 Tax=Streptomyces cinnamoneus TaxID=53446 RepID=A0A2G1XLP1_STRCJ|nr:AfsR/SARP family transcriptional regulator [Streptomyces cinnamoneus]PHQ52136.1 hypothetical protein BLA24_09455 [Streptomyces cinnamoneus]PPT16216.1 AfsR family transcriptional regulator [Streptomyces cinnamoneus]
MTDIDAVAGDGELRFSVLGPLRAWRGEQALELGSPQQQSLLAELLLRRGRPASAAEIVDALWGDRPPARAVGTLRTYASRLRKLLEPGRGAGATPRILVSVSDGYALRVPRRAVDAARFEDQLAAARRARTVGRPAEARALLRAATALWNGEPLTGLTGAAVPAHRARLTELRLTALESRLELDLELGAPEAALPELSALTARHPLRERLRALHVLALHRDGRHAEALAAYEDTRRVLAEELGLEPGRELAAVRRCLTAPRPAADRCAADDAYEPAAAAGLPGDLADFTGRTAAVAELCAALAPASRQGAVTVAVSGIGGVGKSALAAHVAHRLRADFPDGRLYADLRGTRESPAEPAAVLGSFLRALGVPGSAVPDGPAERAALFRTRLADRRVLIVLDDARDADQVRPLLPGTPECAVLVTGRAKLAALPSVRLVDLDVMTVPEALALLAGIVGEGRTRAEPEAAEQLVAACGFLPLAVRVAATRLATRPSWTLAALAARLADPHRRLGELRVAGLSVEDALAAGHERLDSRERRALALLALPDGPDVCAAAAGAVLGVTEREAEPLCESLVDASLLESPAPGRYRFHDLLRLHARARAEAEVPPRERAAALRRLLDFYVATARAAHLLAGPGTDRLQVGTRGPGLSFDNVEAARAWIFAEAPCLFAAARQAAAAADTCASAADLLLMMDVLFEYGAHEREFEEAARAVTAGAPAHGDGRAAGRAGLALGYVYYYADRIDELVPVCHEVLALSRAAGDDLVTADCLVQLSRCAQHMRRHEEAHGLLAEALAVFRAHGDRYGEANATGALARVYLSLGQGDRALAAAERCLAVHRGLGGGHRVAFGLYRLGVVLAGVGRATEAAEHLTEALGLFRGRRNRLWEGLTLFRLAETRLRSGHVEEAVIHAELAVAALAEVGESWGRAKALHVLGHALDQLSRPDRARACWLAAHAFFARMGVPEADDLQVLIGWEGSYEGETGWAH